MAQATIHFPKGFLWGTATAAHQVEGNNSNNSWWAWEQKEGKIAKGHKSGLACDWWGGRWKEDLDRASEGGQNSHRLSVEWSRIQPAPDRWDEDALERYRSLLRGMNERGLTPLISLHHFTNPIWLEEQGGWENDDTPQKFAAYVRKTVDALKEYATYWVTINEPNVYAVEAYLEGLWPPGKGDVNAVFHVYTNLVRGHALAYRAVKEIQPHARVGSAPQYAVMDGAPGNPLNKTLAGIQSALFNEVFPNALVDGTLNFIYKKVRVPEAAGTQDFIGVNYYTRYLIKFNLAQGVLGERGFRPDPDMSETGHLDNYPEGFFTALKWATKFNVPIIVTENGVEDSKDTLRPRYIAGHIMQLWHAVNLNYPIKGYYHWSLVDNFEWERGWTQRFGLWALDVDTQTRTRRPSAELYAEICKENGLSSEMVAKYCPEVLQELFPD